MTILPDGSAFVTVTMAPYRKWTKRWRHKLFGCPTFWRTVFGGKPAWVCPGCGKRGTCYWDGNDVAGHGTDWCNACARELESK